MGNLFSLKNAINRVGYDAVITNNPEEILESEIVFLPGVGSYNIAIQKLKEKKLDIAVKSCAKSNKIIVGICLGMQLLFQKSFENGENRGLSILKGEVNLLPDFGETVIVPKVGWANNNFIDTFRELNGKSFYFVHSYYVLPKNKDIIISNSYHGSLEYASAVKSKNIFGFQFHPEKSGESGLKLLKYILENTLRENHDK